MPAPRTRTTSLEFSAWRGPRAWAPSTAIAIAMSAGCATNNSPLGPDWQARLEQAEAWIANPAAPPSRESDAMATVGEPRSANDYVALALVRNPSLQAAEARIRRLAERAPQARSLDDPMITVIPLGAMAQTAAGEVGLMSSISQRLPLPAKLDAREAVAKLEADQARSDLAAARLQVAADARRAFWNYSFAWHAIATTTQSRALLLQFRDVADAQFRAGQRNQQDVLRAAAELGNLDTEIAVLSQRRDTAAAMLRQLIDAPAGHLLPEPAHGGDEEIAAQRDLLLVEAGRRNPSLQRLADRMRQFKGQQQLANLNRWPDLTVSFSYNLVDDDGLSPVSNGDDQWWVGFGVNLPIWKDKYDAAEREAVFGRIEAASELAAERNRVTFRVEDALLRLESQRDVLRLLRHQVIPDARAAVEAAAATYRAGTGDFLGLVDNWRKLLGYEVMELQGATNIEQAVADLEQALGADLDRATGAPLPDAAARSASPARSDQDTRP